MASNSMAGRKEKPGAARPRQVLDGSGPSLKGADEERANLVVQER